MLKKLSFLIIIIFFSYFGVIISRAYKTNNIDINDKFIALTFDDGPSKYTNEIIKILSENDCSATFFIVGNKIHNYPNTIQKIIDSGNEIGNHTYSHKILTKLNMNELKFEINTTNQLLKRNFNYDIKVIRPSYGISGNKLKKITDLSITLWNIDTLDWKYHSVERIIKRATNNLKDGNIILMHDSYKRSVLALKEIISIIKKQGYKCVTISELNAIKKLREY